MSNKADNETCNTSYIVMCAYIRDDRTVTMEKPKVFGAFDKAWKYIVDEFNDTKKEYAYWGNNDVYDNINEDSGVAEIADDDGASVKWEVFKIG